MNKLKGTAGPEEMVGSVVLHQLVGKGAYGVVYKGTDKKTSETVAVKRFALENLPQEELAGMEMEITLLQVLDHDNIVRFYDSVRTNDSLNIILEYMDKGSLQGLLNDFGVFPESVAAFYTKEVLRGLLYLHEQGIMHRDIKGANILLSSKGEVKLADFGVATNMDQAKKSDSVVGTPYWMAPEIIEMAGGVGTAVDIWSLGCTVVEFLSSKPPYFDLDPMPALFRIVQDDHPPFPPGVSPACEDFLMLCFQKDPHLRSSAEDLLTHPWIKKAKPGEIQIPVDASEGAKEAASFINDVVTMRIGMDELEQMVHPNQGVQAEPSKSDSEPDFPSSDDDHDPVQTTKEDLDVVTSFPHVNLADFVESIDDDQSPGTSDVQFDLSKLTTKAQGAWEDEDEDIFDDFDELDMVVDTKAKVADEVELILEGLNPLSDDSEPTLRGIRDLKNRLQEYPQYVNQTFNSLGVISLLEMLSTTDEDVLLEILSLIFSIMEQNPRFLQSMSLAGLVPAIIKLIRDRYSYEVRLEASKFIRAFCTTIPMDSMGITPDEIEVRHFVKRIFIASGGLQALVVLVDQRNYETYKDLVFTGIDCIQLVLDTAAASNSVGYTNPRSDFVRLFCKSGLITPLITALMNLDHDIKSLKAAQYVNAIANLLLVFASNGKTLVKLYLSKRYILEAMVYMLESNSHQVKVTILKAIQVMTVDLGVKNTLEEVGFLPKLVQMMGSEHPDIVVLSLPISLAMFQLSSSRQEKLALCGIIPLLQKLILSHHHARQIPMQMICALASTSQKVRYELKKYAGVEFYLDLLHIPHFGARSLDALSTWIADEPFRVEMILVQHHNLHKVIMAFKNADRNDFGDVMISVKRIVAISTRVNIALGHSGTFLTSFTERLLDNAPVVQLAMLGLVRSLMEQSPDPSSFGTDQGLDMVLEKLSRNKKAVLLKKFAEELLKDFKSEELKQE